MRFVDEGHMLGLGGLRFALWEVMYAARTRQWPTGGMKKPSRRDAHMDRQLETMAGRRRDTRLE